MFKIKRNDLVYAITGKDKGKKGKVLKVFPDSGRVIVAGINMVKKHRRKTREDRPAGIVEVESALAVSNLMLFCKHCNRPVRAGINVLNDGSRTRICRKCKEVI